MSAGVGTENPLTSIQDAIVFDVRDWAEDRRSAWIYGVVCGWDDESDNDNGAMAELQQKFGWDSKTVDRLRRLHEAYEKALLALSPCVAQPVGTAKPESEKEAEL